MANNRSLLEAALVGYQHQITQIEATMTEIRAMLGGAPAAGSTERRKISAAGRRRMAAAQRKRWAAARGATGTPSAKPAKKRRLSPEGRKRIIEATKKRWAAIRAQKAAAK
jgi:hypothetical protein